MVVDDDPVMRQLVAGGLRAEPGLTVLLAEDGAAAIEILEREDVALVITDLQMPGMSGIDLLKWAKPRASGPDWIVLSGVEDFEVAIESIHCGAFDFLKKPPHVDELMITVRNALERRQLVAEREHLLEELRASSAELLSRLDELERQSERIRRDLERAQVIQQVLLPAKPPPLDKMRIHALYRPATNVGGDMYDVVQVGDHEIVIYVADATGHGIAAAMLSVMFKQRLVLKARDGAALRPAEVLRRANRSVSESSPARGMFLTVAMALVNTRTGVVTMASAGHTPSFVVRASGELEIIDRSGPAIGISADPEYPEVEFELATDDRLLFYTDGSSAGFECEAVDTGFQRAVVEAMRATSGGDALRDLFDAAIRRAAADERDDVTLVCLEASPGESRFDNGDATDKTSTDLAGPRAKRSNSVWLADSASRTVIAVHGRGTWMQSDEFHRHAIAAVEAGKDLVIDLEHCEYLDSAFLGTIHEVVVRRPDAQVSIAAPGPSVVKLFEELGLRQVLSHVVVEPADYPADPVPLDIEQPARESQLRLLRAHQMLASLSDENRVKFQDLVAALRAELGE